MTKHGDSIRTLAESPLVGPRFKDFISRWEMNIEPPPVEKADRYVCTYPRSTPVNADTESRTAPSTPQRWGQGKLPDTLEEDYFNSQDDEDEAIPIVSTPPPRGGIVTGKRKRPRTGLPVLARSQKPFNGTRTPPPLGSLVDYGDDDVGSEEGITSTPGRASPIPGGFIPASYNTPPDAPPASPRLAHRQVSIKSPITPEEDGDILAELSKGGASLLPRISGMSDAGVGSKRRRGEDDDDDELLERLANKSKRQTPNPTSPAPDADSTGPKQPGPTKTPEEGPKKFKLKIGAVGAAVASSPSPKSSSPSSTGTKDGDNG